MKTCWADVTATVGAASALIAKQHTSINCCWSLGTCQQITHHVLHRLKTYCAGASKLQAQGRLTPGTAGTAAATHTLPALSRACAAMQLHCRLLLVLCGVV
jgi:hypothetical protein